MGTLGLVAHIDEAAAELIANPSDTYEIGVRVATRADGCVSDAAQQVAAKMIRDAFGTWVERIHTYGHCNGSTLEEAEGAHRNIEAALTEWLNGGRDDPAEFGRRWRATVERVETAWLDDDGQPLMATE